MADAFHVRILMQVCRLCFSDEEIVTKQKLFGFICSEVSKLCDCTPKFKKDGGYKNRTGHVAKAIDFLHDIPNKTKIYYNQSYIDNLQNFKQLWTEQEVGGYKIVKKDKIMNITDKTLGTCTTVQFLEMLIPHILGKELSGSIFNLKKHLTLSFTIVLALVHRMQEEEELDSSLQDTLHLFAAYASIVSLIIKNKCGICGFDLFVNQAFSKHGLEPGECENLVLMRYYKLCQKYEIKPDISMKIHGCIQKCIKSYLPRQNTTNDKMDARKIHANRAFELFCESLNSPPPTKMKKEDIERHYYDYKQDTKELFQREKILDSTYTLDNTGDLLKNGRKVELDTFLNFIREKLILKQFKELSTSAKITVQENKPEIETLTLAFRIFFGRYCLDMAMANNVASKPGMKEWENHVNVIAEFAIYVAVLDATCHVKYGICGIQDVLDRGCSLPTDKQFRTDNQNLDKQMPVCVTGKKLHNRLFQVCVGDSEKRTRETVQIYRLSKQRLRQLEKYLPNFGTNDPFEKKQSNANKTVNVFHGVPWKRERYLALYDDFIKELCLLGNEYSDTENARTATIFEVTEDDKIYIGKKTITGKDQTESIGENKEEITGDHLKNINEDTVLKLLMKLQENRKPKDLILKVKLSFKIFIVLVFMLIVKPMDETLLNYFETFALYTSILSSNINIDLMSLLDHDNHD